MHYDYSVRQLSDTRVCLADQNITICTYNGQYLRVYMTANIMTNLITPLPFTTYMVNIV